MNNRGNLLTEQTLKIVISVICIGFLVYFLLSLYFNNVGSQNLEFAESSLNSLVDGIKLGEEEIEIYNPKDWHVLSWPFEEKIPAVCSNRGWESCICICKTGTGAEGFLKKCDNAKEGICLENPGELVVSIGEDQRPVAIKNPPLVLAIDYENKKIFEVEE